MESASLIALSASPPLGRPGPRPGAAPSARAPATRDGPRALARGAEGRPRHVPLPRPQRPGGPPRPRRRARAAMQKDDQGVWSVDDRPAPARHLPLLLRRRRHDAGRSVQPAGQADRHGRQPEPRPRARPPGAELGGQGGAARHAAPALLQVGHRRRGARLLRLHAARLRPRRRGGVPRPLPAARHHRRRQRLDDRRPRPRDPGQPDRARRRRGPCWWSCRSATASPTSPRTCSSSSATRPCSARAWRSSRRRSSTSSSRRWRRPIAWPATATRGRSPACRWGAPRRCTSG